MKLCATCRRPLNRGGAAFTGATVCVVCRVKASLAGWHYTPPQSVQEARERKKYRRKVLKGLGLA